MRERERQLAHLKSLNWRLLTPQSSPEPGDVLNHHFDGCPKSLQRARRDVWAAMNKETGEQPPQRSFTSQHAPLFIDWPLQLIRLICYITAVWHWSVDSRINYNTPKCYILFSDSPSSSKSVNCLFDQEKNHKQLSSFFRKIFLFIICYFPPQLLVWMDIIHSLEKKKKIATKKKKVTHSSFFVGHLYFT